MGVRRVVAHEADSIAGGTPPHQLRIDTKAEENAWNSRVLSVAVLLMPEIGNGTVNGTIGSGTYTIAGSGVISGQGANQARSYAEKIQAFNPIGFWPFNEGNRYFGAARWICSRSARHWGSAGWRRTRASAATRACGQSARWT